MEQERYGEVFEMMIDCCDVIISRDAMSNRMGIIQKMMWMHGEMYMQIRGGQLFPLASVEVKKK